MNSLSSTVSYIMRNILPEARMVSRILIGGRPIYIILDDKGQKYFVNYNNRWYDKFGEKFLGRNERGTSYKRRILQDAIDQDAIMMSGFPPDLIYEIRAQDVYSFAKENKTIYTPSTETEEEVGIPISMLRMR